MSPGRPASARCVQPGGMSHSDLVHDLVGVVVGLAVDEWPMHGSMADRAAGAAALAVGETAILAAPPLPLAGVPMRLVGM